MIDLALDANDCLHLDANQELALVSDGAEVAQACKIALRAWLGEYFLDQAFGLDYERRILTKPFKGNEAEREIRRVLGEVEGVVSVSDVTITNPDLTTRTADIELTVNTIYGPQAISI